MLATKAEGSAGSGRHSCISAAVASTGTAPSSACGAGGRREAGWGWERRGGCHARGSSTAAAAAQRGCGSHTTRFGSETSCPCTPCRASAAAQRRPRINDLQETCSPERSRGSKAAGSAHLAVLLQRGGGLGAGQAADVLQPLAVPAGRSRGIIVDGRAERWRGGESASGHRCTPDLAAPAGRGEVCNVGEGAAGKHTDTRLLAQLQTRRQPAASVQPAAATRVNTRRWRSSSSTSRLALGSPAHALTAPGRP